jgi:hypothetical protein
MPGSGRRGRPREVDFREVINAVRYLVGSGYGWRMLPIHFWSVANGLWLVSGVGAALSIPDDSRRGSDAGS